MAIIKLVEDRTIHKCSPPDAYKYGGGTIWKCDLCGEQWVLATWYSAGRDWEKLFSLSGLFGLVMG